jgi:hypothetical protein
MKPEAWGSCHDRAALTLQAPVPAPLARACPGHGHAATVMRPRIPVTGCVARPPAVGGWQTHGATLPQHSW